VSRHSAQHLDVEVGQARSRVAVAEELRVSRAAVRVHMAQPPLSSRVN
jgi:DNA-binding transcriptional LysR family regulator